MNISNIIFSHANAAPESPALEFDSQVITYREFAAQITATASRLRETGLKQGDLVLSYPVNDITQVLLIYSVAYLGAIVITADWRQKPAERNQIADRYKPFLIVYDDVEVRIPGFQCLGMDNHWTSAVDTRRPATLTGSEIQEPDAPLFIGLSSGTTGTPSGVMISHHQWASRLVPYETDFCLGSGHRYLSALPLAFAMGKDHVLHHLTMGNTVVFSSIYFTPQEYVDNVNRSGATAAALTPPLIRSLFEIAPDHSVLFPGLKHFFAGGAPMSAADKRLTLNRLTPYFYTSYGSTGAGIMTCQTPDQMATDPDTVGRVVSGLTMEIVEDIDDDSNDRAIGRIRCRGPGVASGFAAESPQGSSHESFRDGWYYPGERGYLRNSSLYLSGRSSNLVVKNGLKIHPEEIEHVLRNHHDISEAAVIGVPMKGDNEHLAAFIKSRQQLTDKEVRKFCAIHLSQFKIPDYIFFVDEFPRTSAGKIRTAALKKHVSRAVKTRRDRSP